MHYGTYTTSGREFKTLLIDKKMDKSPIIVEQYTSDGVRMLRSDDGREFIADAYERMYGRPTISTGKQVKQTKG